MKESLLTILSVVYILGLWVYQLPVSSVERVLMKFFKPIQTLTYTNRQYRMYSPGPRSVKYVPFVVVESELQPLRFLKEPPGYDFQGKKLEGVSRERWSNFMEHLEKAVRTGWGDFSQDKGQLVFQRLAQDVCQSESDLGDPVHRVKLLSRKVDMSDFMGDLVWDPPQELGSYSCH